MATDLIDTPLDPVQVGLIRRSAARAVAAAGDHCDGCDCDTCDEAREAKVTLRLIATIDAAAAGTWKRG